MDIRLVTIAKMEMQFSPFLLCNLGVRTKSWTK